VDPKKEGGLEVDSRIDYPRAINHVGLTVPDLEKAVDWYQSVLGFRVLMGPYEISVSDSYGSRMLKDFFGPELKRLRMVHMSTSNGVGLEIFEFVEPRTQLPENNFEYTKAGFYHICITDPNVEGLFKRIVESGGKEVSGVWEIYRDSGFKAVYCKDPFGNIIEVFSHDYEKVWSDKKNKD
jgi:catechol 2,3-dioxygenase-like lactoylglutathione lyase family enzyme